MEYVTVAANNPVRNILAEPHIGFFPRIRANKPPTASKAIEERKVLQAIAIMSIPKKNGSIGMMAPALNATRLLTEALQGAPSCSIEIPSSSLTSVSNATVGLEMI